MKLFNIFKKLVVAFDVLIVTGIVISMASLMGHFSADFPAGVDAYAYLTRIRIILDWFPHINWNPFWDSGVPFWIWSHPPLSMVTAALMVKVLSITPELSLVYLAAGCFVLLGLGIYGFVYHLSESRLTSLLAVILMFASPASWAWWNMGNYTRVFGLGFFGLSLFFIAGYLKFHQTGLKKEKWYYFGAVLSSGIVYMSHLLSGGFLAVLTVFLTFLSAKELKEKIKIVIKLFLPAMALAAYWYLPLFLTGKSGGRFFGLNPAKPIPWAYLLMPDPEKNWNLALTPLYLSLFLPAIGGLVFWLIFKGKKALPRFEFRAWLGILLFCLGNFIYNFIGHLPFYPEKFYVNGFPPSSAFPAFALFFGVLTGTLIGLLVKISFSQKTIYRIGAISAVLIVVLSVLTVYQPYFRKAVYELNVGDPGSLDTLSQKVIKVSPSRNYRFGTDSSFVADWFNYKYSVPQTRDYFSQGVPYPDWLSWFEKSVWFLEDNYEETQFLLDWYGVKEFFVGEPHFKYEKFKNKDGYEVVSFKDVLHSWGTLPFYEFSQPHSGPILAANNAPTVLFIGKKYDYGVFFRALGLTALDSQNLVSIKGNELIDSYSLDELRRYKAIFLYNYRYRNQKKAFDLLTNYVKDGGNVWLEVANTQERESDNLPEIFPVSQSNEKEITDWNLRQGRGLSLDIELKKIPPPDYEGKAWKAVFGSGLKPWAKPVFLSGEKILFAEGKLGKGQVIWSGMNFPFHLTSNRSPEETRLLKSILKRWATFEKEVNSGKATFIHPEKREIILEKEARGVLFKESYFQNWHAYAEAKGDKKRLDILRAGPDLMYVFVPQGTNKIIFDYRLSWVEKLGWLISIITFILVVLYGLELASRIPFFSRATTPLVRFQKKIFSWWEKEEEE